MNFDIKARNIPGTQAYADHRRRQQRRKRKARALRKRVRAHHQMLHRRGETWGGGKWLRSGHRSSGSCRSWR